MQHDSVQVGGLASSAARSCFDSPATNTNAPPSIPLMRAVTGRKAAKTGPSRA